MGRDKALLPHPDGGTWLERQLCLLAGLGAPLTLLSGWPAHLEQAAGLATSLSARGVDLELLLETRGAAVVQAPGGTPDPDDGGRGPAAAGPHPPQGPLVALGRLMEVHPDQRLLLCPVDMPALTLACLQALLEAATAAPEAIWIASNDRPQPLLGLYPSDARHRQSLRQALARGERACSAGWRASGRGPSPCQPRLWPM